MMEGDDDSFKRPGAVPFSWEIQPGVPKTRNPQPDHYPSLLQPPKKLSPLRLKPSLPSSSSFSSFSDFKKSRPVSPFAPPPSFKLKQVPVPVPVPDSDSHSSGPPTPRAGGSLSRLKSLFGMKKSKSGDLKKIAQESTSPESDHFYESETASEDSSQGSFWSSPKSSFSSLIRDSSVKRVQSNLSSYEKKPFH